MGLLERGILQNKLFIIYQRPLELQLAGLRSKLRSRRWSCQQNIANGGEKDRGDGEAEGVHEIRNNAETARNEVKRKPYEGLARNKRKGSDE